MRKLIKNFLTKRALRQWALAPIVIVTIGLGWKYYWLAFSVPMVILINMLSPLLSRGRFVCGNTCPRGAFFDRILRHFSQGKKIPGFLKDKRFRLSVFFFVFGMFIVQASQSPFTAEHFGHIFWMMCTATTMLAIFLGLFFSRRTWCTFCPVGTFISFVGKDNHSLTIDKNLCVSCRLCEKACPLNINITKDRESGILSDNDCLKCRECVAACPKRALGSLEMREDLFLSKLAEKLDQDSAKTYSHADVWK
ncbi:MAG TPA: FeS-binding protein [Coxiellaceae bacterium]|nr:FeS-binding protein [Coxiellaceae bacterium]HBS51740.1 FeS-binding protein [Coxiellaceae bacterium]